MTRTLIALSRLAAVFAVAIAVSITSPGAHAKAKDGAKPDFQVILLGVGTPVPFMHRFGPATLIIAGDT